MVCGPKCAYFCMFISAWAVIQLTLMGIFFLMNALTLVDDLPLDTMFKNLDDFKAKADRNYVDVAIRCFVTTLLYLCFLITSICCIKRNRAKERRSLMSSPKH